MDERKFSTPFLGELEVWEYFAFTLLLTTCLFVVVVVCASSELHKRNRPVTHRPSTSVYFE